MTQKNFLRLTNLFQKFINFTAATLRAKKSPPLESAAPKPGKRYVVVDLEWNQYPKWIRTPVSSTGVVMPHEIIQIGAIKVDEDFQPIDAFRMGVRLPGRRKLSKHVARVIQKTQEEIDQGYDFPVAYAYFQEWSEGVERFITWGKEDCKVLDNNLAFYSLGGLKEEHWFDAQRIYAMQVRGDHVQTSLEKAASVLGVEDSVTHHDALNDAYITVGVCACLDMEKGMAQCQSAPERPSPASAAKKSDNMLFLHKKFVSARSEGGFETRAAAKQQCEMLRLPCPTCEKAMKLEGTRVSSGDRWMRMATCQEHGKHLVRSRVRHRQDGAFVWSQTIYAPDPELECYYREKVSVKQSRGRHTRPKSGKKKVELQAAVGGQG